MLLVSSAVAAAVALAAVAAPGGAAVLGSVGFVSGSIAAYVDSAEDREEREKSAIKNTGHSEVTEGISRNYNYNFSSSM